MTSDDKKDNQKDQVEGLSLDDETEGASPEEDVVEAVETASDDDAEISKNVIEEDVPVLQEAAVLSAQQPNLSEGDDADDFDVDMEAMDAETLDDMESDVHITGDETLDFADDIDPVVADRIVKAKGGSAKLVAPLAVLLLAAGVGGYIVMNPDVLSGGKSNGPTIVAPSIVAPGGIGDEIASLDGDVPQPVASENQVPRMPQGGPDLADNLSEEVDVAEETQPETVVVVAEPDSVEEDFSSDLEQELAALDIIEVDEESVAEHENMIEPAAQPVIEQGSAESFESESEDSSIDLTEKVSAENSVQLAQNDATPPKIPASTTTKSSGSFQETVSDVAARPTEQSKTLIASDSDTYYDSKGSTLPPVGGEAERAGLRKVDPVTEPASKYVVVNKDRGSGDYESTLVAAKRALKLKRYDSALEMYDKLYSRNKRDPRVLMGLAVAQQNLGMTESALRTYDDLLDLDRNNADAMANMLGLLKKQYPAVALRRLLDLFDDYPRNAMIAAQIGVAYADQGDTTEAFKYLGIASSLEPNNAQHLFNIAIIADRAGKRTDAIKYYEKALEADAVYGSGRSIPRETIYDRLAALRR